MSRYPVGILLVFVLPALPGLGLGASASAPSLGSEALHALLSEANTAFQQANAAADDRTLAVEHYRRAILLYEKIIDQGGIANAKLYYNLGNAYFLTDDLGRAILNYRRAEHLGGSDVNIRNNLAFARTQRLDKVTVQAERRVLETLFFWHYDFSLRTKFFLACLFFALLCVMGTLMVWFGPRPATSVAAALCGILLVGFLVSVTVEARRRAGTVHGVIVASEIVARQGDGPNYPASFKDPLHAGTEFRLLEQRPGWYHIELSDGSEAWIPDDTGDLV